MMGHNILGLLGSACFVKWWNEGEVRDDGDDGSSVPRRTIFSACSLSTRAPWRLNE